MREDIVFKGGKTGLELVINESADFAIILEQLKEKLKSAASFFAGNAGVKVVAGFNTLNSSEHQQLVDLLAEYGLTVQEKVEALSSAAQAPLSTSNEMPLECDARTEDGNTLIVSRMLRGGQRIVFDGSVVIMGDVNPNAEVVASGNITIYGTCRGLAHAGAKGDITATITADKLVAGQLRIAGIISRAPDSQDEPNCRETARIASGVVIIEPTEKCD